VGVVRIRGLRGELDGVGARTNSREDALHRRRIRDLRAAGGDDHPIVRQPSDKTLGYEAEADGPGRTLNGSAWHFGGRDSFGVRSSATQPGVIPSPSLITSPIPLVGVRAGRRTSPERDIENIRVFICGDDIGISSLRVRGNGPRGIERQLLFAVPALQLDMIDASQLADACSGWAARKGSALPDLLVGGRHGSRGSRPRPTDR
jgi:hypothetical protein